MKKVNTSPISGMQELLPESQAVFNRLKNSASEVYRKNGFLNIETPTIDRTEILLAKAGGETEKQIYRVFKTAETAEESEQALRFDHTVPLARYVVEHESDLVFPFKVSQIGKNFRGERAQRGRFREFYQMDVDVIGRGELEIEYDVDVIATLLETFAAFSLSTSVLARISNRKIIAGLLEELGLEEKAEGVYSIIDHSEKVPLEKTRASFEEEGLSEEEIEKMMRFIDLNGKRETVINELRSFGFGSKTFNDGVDELDTVLGLLEKTGFQNFVTADMKIVRGLDYYTGTVFEFALPDYQEIGSVGGGGRYENLAGYFTEQKFPGVGGSIGLSRLFYVLNEHKILNSQTNSGGKAIRYAIIPISKNEIEYSLKVAKDLRAQGETVTVVMTDKKLGDKMKYASRLAEKAIVIGENEVSTGEYQVKEFN